MNQESSRVRRQRAVSANDLASEIHEDHVGGCEEREVHAERVRPEGVVVFGVADRDVATHAFHVVFACPVSKCGGHVLELPLSLGCEGVEYWDAGNAEWAV